MREHRCADPADLERAWQNARHDVDAGLHLVVLADYEWGVRLSGKAIGTSPVSSGGALRLLAFESLEHLSADAVDGWLAAQEGLAAPGAAGVASLAPSVSEQSYRDAIGQIHDYIAQGDVYQVNHTYRLRGQAFGSPVALYRRLRQRQPVAFGALMRLPSVASTDPEWVLSCSPELFVQQQAGRLRARPMKGTAPRAPNAVDDAAVRDALAADVKNRAENLMIVDLLRNDLGRIARIGSVRVPRLFEIESYRTVHQMTSTVEADARPGMTFPDVLRALFPCGSVTGAPKVRAMQVIAELEDSPRGLYTGSIGWLDASGDFCLSVAIRTLTLGAVDAQGLRPAELGVGGGIVADSTAAAEWEETRVKARFLTTLDPGFRLFETLRARRGLGLLRLELHLARLARSAHALGFAYDLPAVRELMQQHVNTLPDDRAHRVRLDLSFDGTVSITQSPLTRAAPGSVLCSLADEPLPVDERSLVAHKTTLRLTYDRASAEAERAGVFDVLFFNPAGELTEGARTNVFVRLDGRWWTPDARCGLLPGVMRERLLQRPGWAAERVLKRADLARAEDVLLCNSLRGLRRVRLAGR